MTSPTLDAFLPAAFRVFLDEVCRIERLVRATMATDAAARADVRPTPAADLRQRLAELLERQRSDARAAGRDADATPFQTGQYLMAAVADTIFQGIGWWGRKAWLGRPLAADFPPPDGVEPDVGKQIASFLDDPDPHPELAQLYLLALAAETFPGIEAASARRRLLELLGEPFPELTGEPEHWFPEAYRRRQARGAATRLPAVRGWLVAVLAAGGLLLAISAPLWLQATAAARQAVQQILAPGSGTAR